MPATLLRPHLSEPSPEPVFERLRAQVHDLGDLKVVRALPTAARRSVGPWVFVDGFGPSERPMTVGSHPHIGICTVTWLLSGTIEHRDSLGSQQLVQPGQVSLMTSGRGLCHTETSVQGPLQGVQLWLALPPALRNCTPGYHHFDELPYEVEEGGSVTVMMGRYQGYQSPVPLHQPTLALDCKVAGQLDVSLAYELEHGLFVMDGAVQVDGEPVEAGSFVYLGMRGYGVRLEGEGRVLVLGGEPLDRPYLLWWNFLANDEETMIEAQRAWNEDDGHFGEVPGATRIPAPELPMRSR